MVGKTSKTDRYDNVETVMREGKLIITIKVDPDEVDVQPSSSGKTMVYATTGGAKSLGGGLKLNLTLYKKP